MKQKTVTSDQIEMTVELRLKKDEPQFVARLPAFRASGTPF